MQAAELRPALVQAADIVADACGAEKVDVFLHEEASTWTRTTCRGAATPSASAPRTL